MLVCDDNKNEFRKRCNMIYEFLLEKPYGKVDGTEYYYKFYYDKQKIDDYKFVNVFELMKNYPKNVGEKLDRIILNISRKFPNIETFLFSDLSKSLIFMETDDEEERDVLKDYLENAKFISTHKGGNTYYKLTAKAWERIGESNIHSKDVFVAISFHDNAKSTREAIRQAIINAKFSDLFMDEIIHNEQIVPKMLRLIKESRFLIMDISDPNYGAYYEAGYAMGMGKEVIITCKEDIHKKNDYKDWLEEKALKPHFDIAQKQILVWENEADLTTKLEEWIKFLFN
jgi:nucleoside 2-deoxyribosyltransferase